MSFMLHRVFPYLLLLALLIFFPFSTRAQAPQPESKPGETDTSRPDPTHPILVELFTSEGCSSCPPADLFLKKIDGFEPAPGVRLIVLSEHVTYWDHDGWKDPNSSQALTDRQSSYETALGEKESFTPQLIVDGTTQLRLNEPQSMDGVLQKAASEPKVPLRISDVSLDPANPTRLRLHVNADAAPDNADVYVAVALDHVESQVFKGENGGKHLEHVAVVEQLAKIGKLSKGKNFSEEVQLKLKPGTDPKNLRIVAFIQEPGPGKLLGAVQQKPTI
jgi:hypothetical protein